MTSRKPGACLLLLNFYLMLSPISMVHPGLHLELMCVHLLRVHGSEVPGPLPLWAQCFTESEHHAVHQPPALVVIPHYVTITCTIITPCYVYTIADSYVSVSPLAPDYEVHLPLCFHPKSKHSSQHLESSVLKACWMLWPGGSIG